MRTAIPIRRPRLGAVSLLTALALALTGIGATAASAAPPAITFTASSPAEGATLTTNTARFAFTTNRTPKQTTSVTCTLAGPTPSSGPCDAAAAYNDLANGAYTFTVTLALTDGGTATATRHFTVHVTAPHVYWASDDPGGIVEAGLDGSDPQLIVGDYGVTGLAVDGSHLYWNDNGGAIKRAGLDGSDPQTIAGDDANSTGPLAVDGSHVYWSDPFFGTISKADLDGGNPQTIATAGDQVWGVAVGGTHVYWTTYNGARIMRAGLDGSDPQTIATDSAAQAVAVDGSHVYWTNWIGIMMADLDGSNPQMIVPGQGFVFGLAVDGSHLYWTRAFAGMVMRADLDGSNPQAIATGQLHPRGIAVSQ